MIDMNQFNFNEFGGLTSPGSPVQTELNWHDEKFLNVRKQMVACTWASRRMGADNVNNPIFFNIYLKCLVVLILSDVFQL